MSEERNKRLTVLLTETEMVDLEEQRSKIGLSKSGFMLLMYKYGLYATEGNRNGLAQNTGRESCGQESQGSG